MFAMIDQTTAVELEIKASCLALLCKGFACIGFSEEEINEGLHIIAKTYIGAAMGDKMEERPLEVARVMHKACIDLQIWTEGDPAALRVFTIFWALQVRGVEWED